MVTIEQIAAILDERGLLLDFNCKRKEKEVSWLTFDSREAMPGCLFICKGAAFKEKYLEEAVEKGASFYISEKNLPAGKEITSLIVSDIRKAMAAVSARFFEYTPGDPVVTGITGTKGKTTTAWYLKGMLDAWQQSEGNVRTGLLSTVMNDDGLHREDAVMTTPEAPQLHEFLSRAKENHVSYVTMEVSSQALKYKRTRELRFQVGIFLNIAEDHISPSEHEDFEDYFSSKLSMFRQSETVCINLDSDHVERIKNAARKAKRVITFGKHPDADIRYSDVCTQNGRTSFRVCCDRFTQRFSLKMKGKFNVENAVAAIAAAYVYKVPVCFMKQALETIEVPGRMETFISFDKKICGIVDFAHNRLSFEKLFDAAFQEFGEYKKIITVFGCPGCKALNRRRELGIIAGLFSDYVVITSDDPGAEGQSGIAQEVKKYVEMTGCAYKCVDERRMAVERAVDLAASCKERVLILLLERGNEKYQKIGEKACLYPTDGELKKDVIQKYEKAQKEKRKAKSRLPYKNTFPACG